MLTATPIHTSGSFALTVHHPAPAAGDGSSEATTEVKVGPSPIVPELKELAWTSGAFVVFAVVMRYFLYPRMRKGMDSRYESIRADHEGADATRANAKAEVASYESELAGARAQAAEQVEVARRTLEAERSARLEIVNAEIAAKRSAAADEADAARAAVQGQIQSAVGDVSSKAIELAVGKVPNAAVVERVVNEVMSVGVSR